MQKINAILLILICLSLSACTVGIVRQEIVANPTLTPAIESDATQTPTPASSATPTAASTATPDAALTFTPSPAPTLTPSPAPPRPPAAVRPQIKYFTAAPEIIDPGESVELVWEASGGELVLYRLDNMGRLLLPAYPVPLHGTLVMTTTPAARNAVSFVLLATNQAGTQAQASAFVQVRCPDTWFFPGGPATCPQPAQTGQGAMERFEHGIMIWLSSPDRVYALYSDGKNPAWEFWSDYFVEGQPETDPKLTAPAGLFQPIRGFGLIWRQHSTARQRLGWAIEQEYEIPGILQCDTAPKYNTCYLGGSGDSVYVLYAEGSRWSTWR